MSPLMLPARDGLPRDRETLNEEAVVEFAERHVENAHGTDVSRTSRKEGGSRGLSPGAVCRYRPPILTCQQKM